MTTRHAVRNECARGRRGRRLVRLRLAWWAGTVITATLALELVIIVGLAVMGTTSHFNKTTAFNADAHSIMAGAMASIALWRNPGMDPARNAAVRWGVAISLLGMGLAFLMTSPTATQLGDFQGSSGAMQALRGQSIIAAGWHRLVNESASRLHTPLGGEEE